MNGENTDNIDNTDSPEDDLVEDNSVGDEATDTEILDNLNDDNIGDMSVELNVEELVASLESADDTVLEQKREIRRKIEEQRAQKEKELDSTYNINLDDDV